MGNNNSYPVMSTLSEAQTSDDLLAGASDYEERQRVLNSLPHQFEVADFEREQRRNRTA